MYRLPGAWQKGMTGGPAPESDRGPKIKCGIKPPAPAKEKVGIQQGCTPQLRKVKKYA
jgi:hypothetical protein